MDTNDTIENILETDDAINDDENEEEMRQVGETQYQPKPLDPRLKNIVQVFRNPQVIEFFKTLP